MFTRAGAISGARTAVPLALSALAFATVVGVLSRQVGLSLVEALLMSGLVFAGSSQAVALSIWAWPVPILAILAATLIVNLRYLLMSAALRPWFSQLPPLRAYLSVYPMADENWALTMREFARGDPDAAFLPGGGLVMMVAWVGGTAIGHSVGALIG